MSSSSRNTCPSWSRPPGETLSVRDGTILTSRPNFSASGPAAGISPASQSRHPMPLRIPSVTDPAAELGDPAEMGDPLPGGGRPEDEGEAELTPARRPSFSPPASA